MIFLAITILGKFLNFYTSYFLLSLLLATINRLWWAFLCSEPCVCLCQWVCVCSIFPLVKTTTARTCASKAKDIDFPFIMKARVNGRYRVGCASLKGLILKDLFSPALFQMLADLRNVNSFSFEARKRRRNSMLDTVLFWAMFALWFSYPNPQAMLFYYLTASKLSSVK